MVCPRRVSVLLACFSLMAAAPARADVVSDWNAIALPVIGTGHPGPAGFIDVAVVQAAVHDAVQAYEHRFQPYATAIQNASGSPIAAVATAARDVLVNRFSAQAAAIHATYLAYLKSNQLDVSNPGVAVGQLAAAGIIALRQNVAVSPPASRSSTAPTRSASGDPRRQGF
jgi:hypothetical protein